MASSSSPFELYKTQTTVVVSREGFLNVVFDALSLYKCVGPNQGTDLLIACREKVQRCSAIGWINGLVFLLILISGYLFNFQTKDFYDLSYEHELPTGPTTFGDYDWNPIFPI